MVEYDNQCVSCGKPCLGNSCPYINIPIFTCDCCDEEKDELYEWDNEQLCIDCIKEQLIKVEG